MILRSSDIINLSNTSETFELSEVETRFDQLYDQVLFLQGRPGSSEYCKIKNELWNIYNKIDDIIGG